MSRKGLPKAARAGGARGEASGRGAAGPQREEQSPSRNRRQLCPAQRACCPRVGRRKTWNLPAGGQNAWKTKRPLAGVPHRVIIPRHGSLHMTRDTRSLASLTSARFSAQATLFSPHRNPVNGHRFHSLVRKQGPGPWRPGPARTARLSSAGASASPRLHGCRRPHRV